MQSKEYLDALYQTAEDKQIEYEKEKQAALELAILTKEGVEGNGNKGVKIVENSLVILKVKELSSVLEQIMRWNEYFRNIHWKT